jgi:hypothetical protein
LPPTLVPAPLTELENLAAFFKNPPADLETHVFQHREDSLFAFQGSVLVITRTRENRSLGGGFRKEGAGVDVRGTGEEGEGGETGTDLRELALSIAQAFSMSSALPPRPRPTVSFADAVNHRFSERRGFSQSIRTRFIHYAGWLWKTGTQDTDCIIAILEDALTKLPDSFYAFYAPKSIARCAIESRTREALAERNKAQWKNQDLALLTP